MTTTTPETLAPSGASSRGSHQLASVAQCPRKWMLRYRKRLRPIAEPPFRMGGTLIHDAVAYHYAERLIAAGKYDTPSWWTGESLDDVLVKAGAGHPDLIQIAKEVYDAYPRYWEDVAALNSGVPWEPVAVEEEWRATVGQIDPGGDDTSLDDEVVTCRTDLVARDVHTGDIIIVDHKTKSGGWGESGRNRLPVWKSDGEYAISWQALLNLYIIRLNFPNETVRCFTINRIKRQPPYDFDRHTLDISPRVYAAVPRTVRAMVAKEREVDGMIAAGAPPVPHLWSCFGRYGACDYLDLCNATDNDAMNAIANADFIAD